MGKNAPASAGRTGLTLVQEDATRREASKPMRQTTEPALQSRRAATAEAWAPTACALKPLRPQGAAHALQLEKALGQQQGPNEHKNK